LKFIGVLSMKVEIHVLQSFPPANLNRDENGMPKSTVFGGYPRARISSQCQKRVTREYYHEYCKELGIDPKHFADRSRGYAKELAGLLVEQGIEEQKATVGAKLAISVLTEKPKKEKDKKSKAKTEDTTDEPQTEDKGKSDTILFLGRTEVKAIASVLINNWSEIESGLAGSTPALPKEVISKGIIPAVKPPKDLTESIYGKPGDVALFGRMMAVLPAGNVDAAVQMAHAIGVNKLQQEFDFFTAVDDLSGSDDAGADHMGETAYNSSTYYRFTTLDIVQLQKNLGSDVPAKAIAHAFAEAFVKAIPTGHQNGFAAHSVPAAVMIVVRNGQPISLVDAFEKPVAPKGDKSLLENAVSRLDSHWSELSKMYGEKSIVFKGIVTRTQLAQQLETLKDCEKPAVDELLKHAMEAAFGETK
jgi:CRISPR system Cascade subunit CasC